MTDFVIAMAWVILGVFAGIGVMTSIAIVLTVAGENKWKLRLYRRWRRWRKQPVFCADCGSGYDWQTVNFTDAKVFQCPNASRHVPSSLGRCHNRQTGTLSQRLAQAHQSFNGGNAYSGLSVCGHPKITLDCRECRWRLSVLGIDIE